MEDYTEVFTWGNDNYGQLGLGNSYKSGSYTVPRFCSFNTMIKQIHCGDYHTIFMARTGYLYSMGSNRYGQLGINNTSIESQSSPCLIDSLCSFSIQSISCGAYHSGAITVDGNIYIWGSNNSGQLGIGNIEDQFAPVKVHIDSKIFYICCGFNTTAVIPYDQDQGSIFIWGEGQDGQLGNNLQRQQYSPVQIVMPEVIQKVQCGQQFTVALGRSGCLYSCGNNQEGQLGQGNRQNTAHFTQIQNLQGVCIQDISCKRFCLALSLQGDLYCWGDAPNGKSTIPKLVKTIEKVCFMQSGQDFTIFKDCKNYLWSWGGNDQGQLGHGDYSYRKDPKLIQTLKNKRIQAFACGRFFSIALGKDQTIQKSKILQKSHSSRSVSPRKSNIKQSPLKRGIDLATKYNGQENRLREREILNCSINQYRRSPNLNLSADQQYRGALAKIREQYEDLKKSFHQSQSKVHQGNQAKLNKLQSKLMQKQSKCKRMKSEIKRLQDQILEASKQFQIFEQDILSSQQEKQKLILDIESYQYKVRQMEYQLQDKENVENQLMNFQLSKQNFIDGQRELQAKFDQVLSRYDDACRQIQNSDQVLQQKDKQIEEQSQTIFHQQQELNRLNDKAKDFEQQLNSLQLDNGEVIKQNYTIAQTNEVLKQEINQLQSQIQNQTNYKQDITQIQQSHENLENLIQKLQYSNDLKDVEIGKLTELIQEWEKGYSKLASKNQQLQDQIHQLELRNKDNINKFEQKLANHAQDYREKTQNILDKPPKSHYLNTQDHVPEIKLFPQQPNVRERLAELQRSKDNLESQMMDFERRLGSNS